MRIDGHDTLLEQSAQGCSSTGAVLIAADTSNSPCRNRGLPDYGNCKKELAHEKAHEKSKVFASNDNHLWACISLLCKGDCVEDISSNVPSCQAKAVVCVHGFAFEI